MKLIAHTLAALGLVLGTHAAEPPPFFDGKGLTGWSAADMKYWSVEDDAIVGKATENVPANEFLWSANSYSDFYLVVDVKLTPNNRNAGIQIRSKPINDHGQAKGYQADVGAGVWGKLYHEHGRGKLDWNNHAAKAAKPGEWNRYEILAVGHRIWTAINGTLCVAFEDPEGETTGKIAFQIHSGPPQEVRYRVVELDEKPQLRLENQTTEQLLAALPKKQNTARPRPKSSFGTLLSPLHFPESPLPAYADDFSILPGQQLVILGGANAAQCRRHGWLEASLRASYPKAKLRVRNLALPTDTIFEQRRPRNFFAANKPGYGERDGREPIRADLVFLWFGQMESLAGQTGLKAFSDRYASLIDELSAYTGAIVLVTPAPFEDPLGIGLNVEKRNHDLAIYTTAIRDLAKRHQLHAIDLSKPSPDPITSDGALLSPTGHHSITEKILRQLQIADNIPAAATEVREDIIAKDQLWERYWLPTNWAFLYGDRQSQPSSRSHKDRSKRWFPGEIRSLLDGVEAADADIDRQIQAQ